MLAGVTGVADKVISGWAVNGITTFQEGLPLALTMNTNFLTTYALQGTQRPNVVAGCARKLGGPIQKRLGDAGSGPVPVVINGVTTTVNQVINPEFNLACFTAPTTNFSFGNESRTDNGIRSPGTANYDLALSKETHITERVSLQLRIESFNLFNRVQFGSPNLLINNPLAGQITTQANSPRLLQLGGRVNF